MPTDSNGNYSLPTGYLATTGATIVVSQHNPILEDIQAALTARLCANGATPVTAPLKFPDGAAAAPALTFSSSTNSGLYKSANGIGVAIGGVKVAEFTSGGVASGARYLGEIFDYVLSTAPALCVFPVGQTLSRSGFPDLWALAQTEIAGGNTFFNSGNGSTTFGIGDLRGRVTAAKDNMGGSAASRLTGTSMSPDGNTIGATGGAQTHALTVAQHATLTSTNGSVSLTASVTSTNWIAGNSNDSTAINTPTGSGGSGGTVAIGAGFGVNKQTSSGTATGSVSVTSTGTGGATGAAHPNTQPTMIVNKAMFAGA